MANKVGQPKSNTKNIRFGICIDQETMRKLDGCCNKLNVSRAEIIRRAIVDLNDRLKREK